jgi:uncharacterized membrane protein
MLVADLLRWVHVIGAAVLLGTGAGIAFFMLMAYRTRDPLLIAHVAGTVVVADALFTATAVVVQPVTGYFLARATGWPLESGWIVQSLILYVFTGVFWLPVVVIQIRMRDLARDAAARGAALPRACDFLFRVWFACGIPAFAAVLAIIWMMVTKTALV